MPHVPLRGHPSYLFLLYILFLPRTFGFSARTCRFGVPCSETCHLYLNATGASLRAAFGSLVCAVQSSSPFTAQNHFAPSIPEFPLFSHAHPLLLSSKVPSCF